MGMYCVCMVNPGARTGPTQTCRLYSSTIASGVIGQRLLGRVFTDVARRDIYLFTRTFFFVFCCVCYCAYWRGIIVKLTKMLQDVVILTYAKLYSSMLASDGTGSSQSLNTARISSNAILSHFIFEEKHKFWMNSIEKLFDISSQFFLRVKVHTYILSIWNPFQDFSIFSLYQDLKHDGKNKISLENAIFYMKSALTKMFICRKTLGRVWGPHTLKRFSKRKWK